MDADLQEVKKKESGEGSSVKTAPGDTTKSTAQVRKISEVKNNNNTLVTAKLQGLLEKISASTVQQPKERAENENENTCGQNKLDDAQLEESSNCRPRIISGEDDSESDEETKVQYRSEMLKQAMSDFYKGQSTVSFLRRFIYADGKYW